MFDLMLVLPFFDGPPKAVESCPREEEIEEEMTGASEIKSSHSVLELSDSFEVLAPDRIAATLPPDIFGGGGSCSGLESLGECSIDRRVLEVAESEALFSLGAALREGLAEDGGGPADSFF